jgi:hypothetical protein
MQEGGDLVLMFGATQLWDNGQDGHTGANLLMQEDGNLVSYFNEGTNGGSIWSTMTSGQPGASLALQNDGNLVVTLNGMVLWSSNTGGN